MNVVSECMDMFNVLSVADYIVKRKSKFLTGYINSQNALCMHSALQHCKERFELYGAAVTFNYILCDIFLVTFS